MRQQLPDPTLWLSRQAGEDILQIYAQDGNVERGLPALSIYVGHAKVVDTYWYMTGIPELMAIAAERFHRYAERVPT